MQWNEFQLVKQQSEFFSMNKLAKFTACEEGAVTVDWVVLTAGVVGFGALAISTIMGGVQHVDSETGNALSGVEVQEIVFDYGN